MNKERILALADLIEKQPHTTPEHAEGFTMANWSHDCGTPACIAGWATRTAIGAPVEIDHSALTTARMFLGLSIGQADQLFEPDLRSDDEVERGSDPTNYWDGITPAHAAFTLRNLAENGVVDWKAFDAGHPVGANLHE